MRDCGITVRKLAIVFFALFPISASSFPSSLENEMSILGEFRVSNHGNAEYSVPIVIPEGTAGLVPDLSLEYVSGDGNGLMGLGWSLSGLPLIYRCAQTIAQDDVRGSVQYNTEDRFCLGGQRLVKISGSAYGIDGAEYRSEIEQFSKIVSYGAVGTGPRWFKLWTKSGKIIEFGNTTDSRVLAQGKTTAQSWGVNKIADTSGNYLTVTYTSEASSGHARPVRIDYTGNTAGNLAPYNAIVFEYENRLDSVPFYQGGSVQKIAKRLARIKTYAESSLVRDYRLTYTDGDNILPSRLTALELCFGGGTCLPKTTFTWSGGSNSYNLKANPSWGGSHLLVGDWAGTGRMGVFQQSLSSGGTSHLHTSDSTGALSLVWSAAGWDVAAASLLCVADWNADGKDDVGRQGESVGTFSTYVSTGSGFNLLDTASVFFFCSNIGGSPLNLSGHTIDYSGDGYPDLFGSSIAYPPPGHPGNWVSCDGSIRTGNGEGTFSSAVSIDACSPFFGDFNGDGLADFIGMKNATSTHLTSRIYLANGAGFTDNGAPPAGLHAQTLKMGDFNGDGKTDALAFYHSVPAKLFLSMGDGASFVETEFAAPSAWILSNFTKFHLGDFNGDGRTDILYVPSGQVPTLYLSTGVGFVASGSLGLPSITYDEYLALGDFNGDGSTDILARRTASGASTPQYVSSSTPFLLTEITTGLGAVTSVTYHPLTDDDVYEKDDDAVYPVVGLQGPLYVVSSVATDDGIGGVYASDYAYAGAKLDVDGRGFLGFRKLTITDPQTEIVQVTEYLQAFPYIGLIDSQTRKRGAQVLNSLSNEWTSVSHDGGKRFRVLLKHSVEANWDLDGSVIPAVTTLYTYDGYNNPTEIVISTPDGASKTTVNTYSNDTTAWRLGQLLRSEVTSTVP